ncbi:MAG TPA: thermonuclease family protein [Nitrospiraceae bacterium]|jgi:endonuclease YncB( thermonuclease family)|nr:thermonuclease family protein [Nitrospiraceae bacterium]
MRRALPYARIVGLVAGLLLALPGSLDAGTAAAPKKTGDAQAAQKVAQAPPQRCLCKAKAPKRLRAPGSSRPRSIQTTDSASQSWNRRAREAALLRRMMLARLPLLMQEPKPRHLNEWQIRLIDGDTFAYGAERIRIRGIDTPEVSETGGFDASQRLDLLLREGPVMIIPQALDKYGRTLADVFVNDRNVAEVLKDEGYAKQR